MKTESKHTKEEWKVGIHTSLVSQCPTVEIPGGSILISTGGGFDECQQIAERIVKAVNMHDGLVNGLRKIMNGSMANLDSAKKLDRVYTGIERLLKKASE